MRSSGLGIGCLAHDEEILRGNVALDAFANFLRRLRRHQSEIDRRARLSTDGVRGLFAHMTGSDAAKIQRWQENQLVERFAFPFDTAESELAFEIVVDVGDRSERVLLGGVSG